MTLLHPLRGPLPLLLKLPLRDQVRRESRRWWPTYVVNPPPFLRVLMTTPRPVFDNLADWLAVLGFKTLHTLCLAKVYRHAAQDDRSF